MPSKRSRPKPFKAALAVKAAAREKMGTPPPTRAAASTKKRVDQPPRHKTTLEKLLREAE